MDHTAISSASNPRIRSALGLRDRRERDRQGLTLVDGIRELARALDAGVEIVEAFVAHDLGERVDGRELLARLEAAGTRPTVAAEPALARIAFGDRSEGIVAVVRTPATTLDGIALPPDPLVVVVEGVEKPGNLGAVLRSADGAGADAVVAVDPRTDLFNPNAIRASIGTIFGVPLASSTATATLEWLLGHGIRAVATVVDAPRSCWEANLRGPIAIVVGNEAEGLTAAWRDDSIETVRIPMRGRADSLNVSVSAAILLYEARRQREYGTSR